MAGVEGPGQSADSFLSTGISSEMDMLPGLANQVEFQGFGWSLMW